eukprot:TRINITY_DN7417_c0_g1_i1.p1 TRINITY_DN7417_c0_g1~~TRINITY_DN7417_c0_g1_i1.p1  ORF type:complete len:622 (+),score=156.18 TRINITY_DN7417_c0_g1_i1:271-1866(+)
MWGISFDNKVKNLYSIHMVVEKIENAKEVTLKQKDAKMPLVGRIEWTLLKTRDQIWLNLKAEESGIEFVVGEFDQKMNVLFLKGVELDNDGKNLLELDQHKILISKSGLEFEGKSKGDKANWKSQLMGGNNYLLPNIVEELKEQKMPKYSPLDITFNPDAPIFYNNHLSPKLISTCCVCFEHKACATLNNTIKHPLSSHVHYCSVEHRNSFFKKHLHLLKLVDLILKKEEAYYSMEMLEEIDNDENQVYFPLIAFFGAVIQKLGFECFDSVDLNSIYKNEKFQRFNNMTNTDSHIKLESLSTDLSSPSLFHLEKQPQHAEIDTMLHLKILVDASEVFLSEIEEMIEREIEDKDLHTTPDEYFPQLEDVRIKNMLDCGLHLLSRAHKIFLTDLDFSRNKSLRRQYLATKETILKNLIWFTSKTPHTVLVSNYYADLYNMYLNEILPITPSEHLNVILNSFYVLSKRFVAQIVYSSSYKLGKKLLLEGTEIATKANHKDWILFQQKMLLFLEKSSQTNNSLSLHMLLHIVDKL